MTLETKIEHPAVWRGEDMAADSECWTYRLSADEISELEQAARGYLSGDGDIAAMSAHTFPLPELTGKIRKLRETLIHGIGFHLIKGLPVERYDAAMAAAIFCGIGAHLGSARSQNAKGHILGHVTDVGADISDPKVRVYQTTARQTFHTDSTDCVGLLCLREAKSGGDSLLVSSLTLFNEMAENHPDVVSWLFEPVATDRRGEVPQGMNPWFEIPVLSRFQGHLTGLYHRQYIESASRHEGAPRLNEQHKKALDTWDDLANDPALHLCMRLEPGDMQFVYNHHLLHDRTAFEDWPDPARRRHLLRLWLALPGDRPLPPVFKQRYGSIDIGDRGGIILPATQLHAPLEP